MPHVYVKTSECMPIAFVFLCPKKFLVDLRRDTRKDTQPHRWSGGLTPGGALLVSRINGLAHDISFIQSNVEFIANLRVVPLIACYVRVTH